MDGGPAGGACSMLGAVVHGAPRACAAHDRSTRGMPGHVAQHAMPSRQANGAACWAACAAHATRELDQASSVTQGFIAINTHHELNVIKGT